MDVFVGFNNYYIDNENKMCTFKKMIRTENIIEKEVKNEQK